MPFEFCVPVPVSERHPTGQQCFDIPVLVDQQVIFGPPEPPERVEFRDWRILATIDSLAEGLSAGIGRDLVESVGLKMQEAQRALGPGMTLSRTPVADRSVRAA